MTTIGAIVTFAVTWWLVLFMVLPFGVRPQDEPVPGSDLGAPQKSRMVVKMMITTVVAAIITYLIALFIDSGMISLRPELNAQ